MSLRSNIRFTRSEGCVEMERLIGDGDWLIREMNGGGKQEGTINEHYGRLLLVGKWEGYLAREVYRD